LAAQVLTLADQALQGRPLREAEARQTLDEVRVGLSSIKSAVFDNQVREEIKAAGWQIEDFEQRGRHRPDFKARRSSQRAEVGPSTSRATRWIIVAARTATLPQSKLLKNTINRLAKPRDEDAIGSLIVVPDGSRSIDRGLELIESAEPARPLRIAKLDEVPEALREMEQVAEEQAAKRA
jgi:hypothetical protein